MLKSALLLLINSFFLMLRINPVDSFPKPLSRSEEENLLERWAGGDTEARSKLIEHNLRLVSHIMKKYYTNPDEADDLVSIGTIGLIKGINTYKPGKGTRLATYASRCIENELLMHFRSRRRSAAEVSLSDTLDLDSDGGSLSVMDVVADEENMEERVENEELCRSVINCVNTLLTEREARIISLRYGLNGERAHTQRETAQLCAISRSYVSRIEKRALAKLRAELTD